MAVLLSVDICSDCRNHREWSHGRQDTADRIPGVHLRTHWYCAACYCRVDACAIYYAHMLSTLQPMRNVTACVTGISWVHVYVCTGWVYPTIVHWTWSGNGKAWLTRGEDNGEAAGYTDFAGSGIVHCCGGTAALIGAIIVGPRPGRPVRYVQKPYTKRCTIHVHAAGVCDNEKHFTMGQRAAEKGHVDVQCNELVRRFCGTCFGSMATHR